MSGDSEGADAVHREVMARIRDEIGSPAADPGPAAIDPLAHLSPALRAWWTGPGRGVVPTLVLRCAACHAGLGEIVCDAHDLDLAVIVARRTYGDDVPVELGDWSPGEHAAQLDAGGQAVLDGAGRSLADLLRARQADIDAATLRVLGDGRRVMRRYREEPDVAPLDGPGAAALCPEHGWITLDLQSLRAALETTQPGARRKLPLQPGTS